jgi:osmoprotectant transport system ATP-binding protein
MSAAVLRAAGVSKRFGDVVALDGVSLEVAAGECVALVGESGSGKSTLLRVFNGLTTLDGGEAFVGGQAVASVDPVPLRRGIGYVPQDGGLLPHWTVAENAALVPRLTGRADAQALASAALDLVGLRVPEFGPRWPHQLSGGQRQRVAFARAIAGGAPVVLLDEPFGALDAITRSDLQAMFLALRARTGMAALLVTHDLHEAARLADRIAVIRGGRIEQTSTPAVLMGAPATPYVADLLVRARLTGARA